MYVYTDTQGTFHPEATRVIVTVDALAEWEKGHTSLTGVVLPFHGRIYILLIVGRLSFYPTTSMPNIHRHCGSESVCRHIPYALLLCFM